MHDEFAERLSDYLDDELTREERDAVEAHLAACPACATTLADLQRVVERARSIGPRPPRTDLWPGIASRIASRSPLHTSAKRISFTLSQLAAAAVVLIALSSAVGWQLAGRSANHLRQGYGGQEASRYPGVVATERLAHPEIERSTEREASAERSLQPVSLADAQYDAAVADLEHALAKGRGRLDKTTIAIVEENLSIIDQAIAQAREALASDPANTYLSGHLVEARRKKLDLLRRATALTNETN